MPLHKFQEEEAKASYKIKYYRYSDGEGVVGDFFIIQVIAQF